MFHRIIRFFSLSLVMLALIAIPQQASAQDIVENPLEITTPYPSQVVELGETVNIDLKIKANDIAQTVNLEMDRLPEGWEATFRGGGQIIKSVYVEENDFVSIDLQLTPPEEAETGTFDFVISGESDEDRAEVELTLSVVESVPASLIFKSDLPKITGSPDSSFRFTSTLENNSDQELIVNLSAETPTGFYIKFSVSGQEVNSVPVEANRSKSVTITLEPLASNLPSGEYPFTVYANGGELQAELDLTAVVTGRQDLSLSGVDGRLSGKATAGEQSSIELVINNTGTAPAQGVELTSTAPSGWNVTFEPEIIEEIPAGEQAEVTAKITPPDKAVAGDYVVTLKAKPIDGATESAEFRITVTTSTLWGIVGIGLIGIAVIVVALAVIRFGRR